MPQEPVTQSPIPAQTPPYEPPVPPFAGYPADVPPPPPAPRRRRRGLLIALSAVAAIAIAGAVGAYVYANRDLTVRGIVMLAYTDYESPYASTTCYGREKAIDLRQGARVVVLADDGRPIGTGHLGVGRLHSTNCELSFAIDAPRGEDGYTVVVAGRNPVRYSRAEVLKGPVRLGLN